MGDGSSKDEEEDAGPGSLDDFAEGRRGHPALRRGHRELPPARLVGVRARAGERQSDGEAARAAASCDALLRISGTATLDVTVR